MRILRAVRASHAASLSLLGYSYQQRNAHCQTYWSSSTICAANHNQTIYVPLSPSKPSTSFKRDNSLLDSLVSMARYTLQGTPALLLALPAQLLGGTFPLLNEVFWAYSIWSLETLGPAFVKMAQWASTRPDLYPPALTERLERLQDSVTATYPISTVERTLSEAFGPQWRQYLRLESKPIGSGCIAQVYKGYLSRDGRPDLPVAVKVLHPNVERKVRLDMQLLSTLADVLDLVPRLEILSLGDTCRQFIQVMQQQLDLSIEAKNLHVFRERFAKDNWAIFPSPIDGLVCKNILVETYEEGIPIKEFVKLPDNDKKSLALKLKLSDLGCRSVLKMIFFDNFIHGDLHPGNMLIRFTSTGEPQIIFLDCGIVYSQPSEADHQTLIGVAFAFINRDGRRAARLMIDNAKAKTGAEVLEEERFCDGIQKMVDASLTQNYFEHLGDYVTTICNLAYETGVKLDPSYFRVAMALKVVEGISLGLNKDLDMVTKCVPIILQTQSLRKLGVFKFPVPEP